MLTSPGTSFYPTNDEYSKSSLYVVLIETPFPAKSELNRGDIHQNMKFVRCLIDIIMIIVYQITRVNEFPQKKTNLQAGQNDDRRQFSESSSKYWPTTSNLQTMDNNKAKKKKEMRWKCATTISRARDLGTDEWWTNFISLHMQTVFVSPAFPS